MSELHDRIGFNIQKLMLEQGIKTQKELAVAANIHPVQLHRILSGKTSAGVDILDRIASVLKVTIKDLTTEFKQPPSSESRTFYQGAAPQGEVVTERSLLLQLVQYGDQNIQLSARVIELTNQIKQLEDYVRKLETELDDFKASTNAVASGEK